MVCGEGGGVAMGSCSAKASGATRGESALGDDARWSPPSADARASAELEAPPSAAAEALASAALGTGGATPAPTSP